MACYLLKRLRSKKKKKKKEHCFERVLDETATATEMGTWWNKRFQEETLLFTCIFKLSSFAGSPLQNLGQGEINKIFAVFEWEPRQRIIHFYNWNPKLLAHIVFNLKSGAVKDDKNIQPFANYLRKVQIHSFNRSFPRRCCRPYFFVDPHIPTESICSAVFRKDDQFRVWLNTSFKVYRFVLMYHARIKDLKSLFNVKLCHQRPLCTQERHKQGNEKAPLLCHVNKARHVSTFSQELFEDSWSSFVYTWYWKEASENSYNKLSRAKMRLLALIFPCHQSWNLFIICLLLFAKNGKFEP